MKPFKSFPRCEDCEAFGETNECWRMRMRLECPKDVWAKGFEAFLKEINEKAEAEIIQRGANDADFLGFEDNRDHIFYAGQAVGKRDLSRELLGEKE